MDSVDTFELSKEQLIVALWFRIQSWASLPSSTSIGWIFPAAAANSCITSFPDVSPYVARLKHAVSGNLMGGNSLMIVRSRVSVSGSKLLCPAVVMK